MNRDLESALGELAARVEQSHRSTRAPLPVELMTARVRRHRRNRAVLVVTGAAAATVVVAGAAFALLPDRAPAPPAITPTPSVTTQQPTPTPTPTPTPSPTPTQLPVVLPVGNPALPFGVCGSLADAAPAHPVDDRVGARLAPDATTLAAGGFVSAGGELESTVPDRALAFAVPDGGPRVAVVRDGVVVGTTSFYPATYDVMAGRGTSEGRTAFRGLLDLTVCDPGDGGPATAGRPLPAGTYELRPWASVVVYGGQEPPAELSQGALTFEQAAALGGTRATAVGDATTVTVTGEAEAQLPRPGADVPLDRTTFAPVPACGAPAPATAPVRSAMVDLQVAPASTTLAAGAALHATATVQYTGPGRLRTFGYYAVEYWVVRDGIVVGATVQANDAFSPVDLGAGALLGFPDAERVLTSCTGDGGAPLSTGEPLPAGEYTVYPGWIFSAPQVRLPSETVELQDPGDSYSLALGTPFTVTLT